MKILTPFHEPTDKLSRWNSVKVFTFLRKWGFIRHLTHYQVLNVKENCNREEIRQAYIKLSKENHPDGNIYDKSRHLKFVEINEAYAALVNAKSRLLYDESLRCRRLGFPSNNRHHSDSVVRTPRAEDAFWCNRDNSHDSYYGAKPYYGIRGIKRMPNSYIANGCFLVLAIYLIGFAVGMKKSWELRKAAIDEKTAKIAASYNQVKKQASETTFDEKVILVQHSFKNKDKSYISDE